MGAMLYEQLPLLGTVPNWPWSSIENIWSATI